MGERLNPDGDERRRGVYVEVLRTLDVVAIKALVWFRTLVLRVYLAKTRWISQSLVGQVSRIFARCGSGCDAE